MTAEGLRQDAFLGGRLHLWQPSSGYRAGMDPVLLAASCPAEPGARVLDIGCGVGTAALCLGARVAGLQLCGIERVPEFATLAQRNAVENGQAFEVVTADVTQMPADLRSRNFDHVLLNPPYFDRRAGSSGPDPLREAAMGQATPLEAFLRAAARRLVPRGGLTMVHRAESLAEILSVATAVGFGSLEVLPLMPRAGRPARLILLRARKGGRTPLILRAPVTLHMGDAPPAHGKDFAPEIAAVLMDGAAMPGWN